MYLDDECPDQRLLLPQRHEIKAKQTSNSSYNASYATGRGDISFFFFLSNIYHDHSTNDFPRMCFGDTRDYCNMREEGLFFFCHYALEMSRMKSTLLVHQIQLGERLTATV